MSKLYELIIHHAATFPYRSFLIKREDAEFQDYDKTEQNGKSTRKKNRNEIGKGGRKKKKEGWKEEGKKERKKE